MGDIDDYDDGNDGIDGACGSLHCWVMIKLFLISL